MTEFGKRVCLLRTAKKMSQAKLAKELNVDKSSVSKWESGGRLPSCDMMKRIAGYFNVSMDYLYGVTDDPSLQTFSDADDAEFVVNHSGIVAEYDELPENVQAINVLLYSFGCRIVRLAGESSYGVFTENGVYNIGDNAMNDLASSIVAFAKEKIDYLEMSERVKMFEAMKQKASDSDSYIHMVKKPLVVGKHDSVQYAQYHAKQELQELQQEDDSYHTDDYSSGVCVID